MANKHINYIRADITDRNDIYVYDCFREIVERVFPLSPRGMADALAYAETSAAKIGCDWGANF